jgi:hypothetical protein
MEITQANIEIFSLNKTEKCSENILTNYGQLLYTVGALS